jgi:Spirocyclase AveC-like
MSATVVRDSPQPAASARAAEPVTPPPPLPVKIWAGVGAVLVAVELFFLIDWVSGSKFKAVPSGPDKVPGWMNVVGVVGQVVMPAAAVFSFYWFLARPWLRERRITTDGLLCIAFLLASPWDPLSTYTNDWFTYNSHLVNFGSVVSVLPGVLGRHGAGVGDAWSVLFIAPVYVAVFIWMSVLFCAMLRRIQRRWPTLGPLRIVGICFVICVVADIVIEGIINAPLGFYAFSGGHWLINGGHYYQYPIHEGVFGGAVFCSFVCLRYFTNDKGETLAERGVSQLKISPARKNWLRGFAVVAAVHVGFLLCYHLPTAIFATNTTQWPKDVQTRSYFTNRICGPEVDRACPGPHTPISRPGAPYLNYEGRMVYAHG